jgi:hypothetical protein
METHRFRRYCRRSSGTTNDGSRRCYPIPDAVLVYRTNIVFAETHNEPAGVALPFTSSIQLLFLRDNASSNFGLTGQVS